jgi:hypothetical protein
MSKHDRHSRGNNQHDHKHHDAKPGNAKTKLLHHDWRFWTAVALMLLAIVAYVVSFDESFRPAGDEQSEVPAALN